MRLQTIDDTVCLAQELIEQLTEAKPDAESTSIAGLVTALLAKNWHGEWLDKADLQMLFDLAETGEIDELYRFAETSLRMPYVCRFLPALNSYTILDCK